MNKQLFTIIIISALIGGIIGSLFASSLVGANNQLRAQSSNGLFQNFYNNYLAPLFGSDNASSPSNNILNYQSQGVPYTPPVDYEQAVINSVKQSSPAVVSVIISKYVPVIEQCPYNPFSDLPQEFQQFFGDQPQFYQPCQKGKQYQEVGGGSGFIISSDGLIVTNKHVVSDTSAGYTVLTNYGKKYKAAVIARDPVNDLAILKINGSNLPTVALGDSSKLQLGQTAIAIGNALGEFRNTVSVGVISGLARSITASGPNGESESIAGLIQTDAAINPGNSGGPLLNLRGQVIGINVAMASGAQNIGFAVPINQVKKAIESVQKTGRIATPYLGTRYLVITQDVADAEKLPVSEGALLRGNKDGPAVIPGSPADKAGLKAGDIIEEVNGDKITTDNTLSLLTQKYNVGDTISLKVLREGKEITIEVKLGQRPKNL